ncbi:MAG: hypothetical protein J7L47_09815 [Candidatus Odinarchaeota archaeon]|nr:hypothetical protein [Candidatus Odinarchaeota archaeon]
MTKYEAEKDRPIWACDEEVEETLGDPLKTNIYGSLQFGILIPVFLFFAYILLLYGPIFFGFMFLVSYGLILYVSFNFIFKDFWSGREFIALYEDKFVINDPGRTGFSILQRNEYTVDVIGLEPGFPWWGEDSVFLILIFNKPVAGLPYVQLDGHMYFEGERLKQFIRLTNPKHVLLDGKYFLRVYAVFRYFYGEKYPELAEALLDDFSDIVEEIGLGRTLDIMNALMSLCISKREKEAVRLAKLITTREIVEKYIDEVREKVDGKHFEKWYNWTSEAPQEDGTVVERKTYVVQLGDKLTNPIFWPTFAISWIAGFLWLLLGFTPMQDSVYFWEASFICFPIGVSGAYPLWSRFSLKSGITRALVYRTIIKFIAAIPVAIVPYITGAPEMALYWNLILLGYFLWTVIESILSSDYPVYRAGLKTAEKIKHILRAST